MLATFAQLAQNSWMKGYLKFLALVFVYTGLVHWANIAGFGEMPWRESPIAWQIGDVVYGVVDFFVVIGLWRGKAWGMALFLGAIASQFVIYTVFIDTFALTAEHRQVIHTLLLEEGVAIAIFAVLAGLKK
jgi:hypothetical protein